MGYWSALHLVDVKIKSKSLVSVKRVLARKPQRGPLRFFLQRVVLDSEGFVRFKASDDGLDPYVPDEDDGTVPAISGKWYEAERIASWLKPHAAKGGRIVLHSQEADGDAWGWEFDGRGRMRALALAYVADWE